MRRAMIRSHERTCAGKWFFGTKAAAKRHIKHAPQKKALNAYLCTHCGWWHVGHKPKR